MGRLSEVTEELATRLLSEVEYGKHLQGTKATPMSGGLPVLITELEEVYEFLHVSAPENLKIIGGRGFVNYLNFEKLKTWVSEVYGDQELADAIGEEIEKSSSYIDQLYPIKSLVGERLQQCKALLQEDVDHESE